MRTATMGKVIVPAKIENLQDLLNVQAGTLAADQVRSVEVTDALVDTGATMLGVPRGLITQLGLLPARTSHGRTPAGSITFQVYHAAHLTVQGRHCDCEVLELPDDCPVLIGQVPLELLDWVVDSAGRQLIGNPAHGGQQMVDVF